MWTFFPTASVLELPHVSIIFLARSDSTLIMVNTQATVLSFKPMGAHFLYITQFRILKHVLQNIHHLLYYFYFMHLHCFIFNSNMFTAGYNSYLEYNCNSPVSYIPHTNTLPGNFYFLFLKLQ